MKDALPSGTNDVSTEIAMRIVNKSRTPVMRWSMNDFKFVELQSTPDFHLMNRRKT